MDKYSIHITNKAKKHLNKFSHEHQKKIMFSIRSILIKNPYAGKRLHNNLSEYYSLRKGVCRILYRIDKQNKTITIDDINYRKDIYRFNDIFLFFIN